MDNPFRLGMPVVGEDFFGRHQQLEDVLQLLAQGAAVNVFSLRRMGKTSMRRQIQHLCKHASQWRRFTPVSVDLAMFAAQSELVKLARILGHELGIRTTSGDAIDAWLEVRDALRDAGGERILLLDEAESLARVRDFGSLGAIRALQQEGALGLVLFTAYQPLATILGHAQTGQTVGSPLWNLFFPVQLPASDS